MAVQVITMKTGDRVITELKEIFDNEGEEKDLYKFLSI